MKVLCFGIAKEITGNSLIQIEEGQINTVAELKSWIHSTYPEFNSINSCMIAVNQEYATDEQLLSSGDEIAIIPPVAGG